MRNTKTVQIGANGIGVIKVKPDNMQTWSITQVSTLLDSAPINAVCVITVNGGDLVTRMIATGDTADQAPPVDLFSSDTMEITWTNCTPGTVAKATYYYELK